MNLDLIEPLQLIGLEDVGKRLVEALPHFLYRVQADLQEPLTVESRLAKFRFIFAPSFADDLADNLARGDANYMSLLDEADAYAARNGLALPDEPNARKIDPDPECVTNPILELNLKEAGVASIIWATGFAADYGWLKVDAFDAQGRPKHQRGVSVESGIYFLGLPWLSRRASSFIWGVWHDAKHLADRIATQRKYLAYQAAAKRQTQVRELQH